jgi:hypothetical protein
MNSFAFAQISSALMVVVCQQGGIHRNSSILRIGFSQFRLAVCAHSKNKLNDNDNNTNSTMHLWFAWWVSRFCSVDLSFVNPISGLGIKR